MNIARRKFMGGCVAGIVGTNLAGVRSLFLNLCTRCGNCARACPSNNFRKHPPMPVVLAEKCNGCGKCQTTSPALAIEVTPTNCRRS